MTKVSQKINTLGIGLFVTAAVLSLSVVSFGTEVKAVGATDYVDIQNPACNNNGPGSQAAPWCSLNKAVVTLNAGDTAYIAPGQYNIATGGYLEDIGVPGNGTVSGLHPTNAGTALNPINLIAQTTAADIIGDGNAPSAQDDAHQAFITNGLFLVDKSHWHIQGFYIKESGQLMSANNSGFSLKDSLLFVEPPNGNLGLGGGSKLKLYNSDQAVVDHIEAWSLYLTCLHFEALSDAECPLVPYFPSCGGTPEADPSVALARFLVDPPPSFFENLKTGERRTCIAGWAIMWTAPAMLFFQRRDLPFYLVEVNAGAGINLAADLVTPVPTFDSALVSARVGLEARPLQAEDIADRRWLTAGIWPDNLPAITELDAALDKIAARTEPYSFPPVYGPTLKV